MAQFTFGSARLHFDQHGAGPCVVFQHGLGSSRAQAGGLLGTLESVATLSVDVPGHGESADLEGRYSFDSMADSVIAMLDHLGVKSCVMGGISMGAGISLNVALRHPDRVRGLILCRPAWLHQPGPPNLEIIARLGEWIESHGKEAAGAQLRNDPLFQEIHAINARSAASIVGSIEAAGEGRRGRVLSEMVGDAPFTDLADLREIDLPAIVLGTEKDPLHPAGMAEELAASLPSATYHLTPPRYVEPERHADAVRNLAGSFLAGLAESIDHLPPVSW